VKIYAVADIHAKNDRIRAVEKVAAKETPDFVVVAGDLTSYTIRPEVHRALARLAVPVVVVKGNTDPGRMLRRMDRSANITCLHLQTLDLNGVKFAGIGGTIPLPFRSKLALREKPLFDTIRDLVDPQTVLVTHPPPFGARDRVLGRVHSGSRLLRNVVFSRRPRVLICGHIHEQAGTEALDQTLVVNCSMGCGGAGAVISLAPDRPVCVRML